MWNRKQSVTLSLVVCFVVSLILTAGLFAGPWAVKLWFCSFRGWEEDSAAMTRMLTLFKVCFYPCAVLAYVTLYSLIRLLRNIKSDAIFITLNVKYLRRISWCCIIVSMITLIAGILYIPYLFICVAAGFMGLMLRVVKNVMENAVQIKEENELTI
ncbi:MAG: DUF2975 domain-containing protein [Oscillospiraceae bacterium]|nr:DUF2975 domain-containing protein [Oscillospiraceae bacterium]